MSDQPELHPVTCKDCGRHVPVYLLYFEDDGDAVGADVASVYCRKCVEDNDGGEDRP